MSSSLPEITETWLKEYSNANSLFLTDYEWNPNFTKLSAYFDDETSLHITLQELQKIDKRFL